MKIVPILSKLENGIGKSKYLAEEEQTILDVCESILSDGFGKLKIVPVGESGVEVLGKKGHKETLSINLDFKNNTQVQTYTSKKDMVKGCLMEKIINIAKGTIDGKLKTIKNVSSRINDKTILKETTDFQDFITGNKYRKVKTYNGDVIFYKNIDGDFVELFPKK